MFLRTFRLRPGELGNHLLGKRGDNKEESLDGIKEGESGKAELYPKESRN